MPTFSDSMSGSGPYYLDLILTVTDTTEGSDPTTTFNWTLRIRRSASYGAGSFDGSIPWNWKFAGTTIASGSYNGNFPAGGATTWTVASGTRTVSMNSDGNRTASITASLTTSTTALGSGAVSDTWVMPRVPVPPTAPGPMVINSTGTTTADVAWGLAADAGGGTLISYTVQWDDVSNFASPASATTTVRNYDITGLTPANNYWTRARIRMSAGYGPYNAAKAFTTDPVAPTTPTAGTSTINTIPINWTKSTNGNAVTGFDIQYDTLSTFATATTVTVGNVTSYTLNGLPPGTTHYIRIRTKTSSGTSPWSGTLTKATITANPPGISVVASPSGTAATVTLTPPATGVTKYTIERQTGTSGPVTTYTTTTTPYSVSGLVVKTSMSRSSSSTRKMISAPSLRPIQLRWIVIVRSGQSAPSKRSSSSA
jgi:hypothetical protein